MYKKFLGIGIIIVVIIIIILIIMLSLINKTENKEQYMENNIATAENINEMDNQQKVENIINKYYNNMKNKDFKSASKKKKKNEFYSVLGETTEEQRIEELLEMAYKDYEEFYLYSIKDIRQITGIEDFRNSTNIDITNEEYQQIFGSYILYLVQIDANHENITNNENIIDVYLFTPNNKMACTIRIMNTYATGGMLEQAKDAKEGSDKAEIKERLLLAISSIIQEIHNNPNMEFKEYCNKEVLQNYISRATINEFNWENDIGKGTITNEDGKTYNFTINLNYEVEVTDIINN